MDRAVYRADADSGSFVAEIGPTGGVLVLRGQDREHVFAEFFVGKKRASRRRQVRLDHG